MSVDFASTVETACAMDGEEAQPSAIILRNDLPTYYAITE